MFITSVSSCLLPYCAEQVREQALNSAWQGESTQCSCLETAEQLSCSLELGAEEERPRSTKESKIISYVVRIHWLSLHSFMHWDSSSWPARSIIFIMSLFSYCSGLWVSYILGLSPLLLLSVCFLFRDLSPKYSMSKLVSFYWITKFACALLTGHCWTLHGASDQEPVWRWDLQGHEVFSGKDSGPGDSCECVRVWEQKATGTWELFQQVSGTKLEILLPKLSHESWYDYYLIPP